MRQYLTKENKHLLWKDECDDEFILTSFGEIYESPNEGVRLVSWLSQNSPTIKGFGVNIGFSSTDDGLCLLDYPKEKLPVLLAKNRLRRRPYLNGAWLKDKEARLAHKIIPTNPDL